MHDLIHDRGLSPNTPCLNLIDRTDQDNKTCSVNYIGENDKQLRDGHILAVAIHLVLSPVDIRQNGPQTYPGDLLMFQPYASTHLL